jgi:hypothetical protein
MTGGHVVILNREDGEGSLFTPTVLQARVLVNFHEISRTPREGLPPQHPTPQRLASNAAMAAGLR